MQVGKMKHQKELDQQNKHPVRQIMQDMKQQSKEESKKERHIVTWTQEEDDILREQIGIHGTVNWAIIASKFKDKTTRQCKRRWYTYLNSDFKKGGWSPEEDRLLCEAQKLFGNRWTEIAKVVSGRTDNAVKNRFSTLCRKREKHAALAEENISYINANKERIMLQQAYINTDASSESSVPIKKKRRAYIPNEAEKIKYGDRSHIKNGTPIDQKARAPLALLAQNSNDVNLPAQDNKARGAFLKKDDLKTSVLMQQEELLSSLALNVDKETMDRSSENAWEVPKEFWNRTKESDILRQKIPDLKLEDLKHVVNDLKDSTEGGQSCRRKLDLYKDSPGSSQYSTGSTLLPQGGGDNLEMKPTQVGDEKGVSGDEEGFISSPNVDQDVLTYCEEQINSDGIVSSSSGVEFSSPVQVTSLFRSLAAGIPSPQFSESERNFLWKTLGIKSPTTSAKPSPPCKRSLLHNL